VIKLREKDMASSEFSLTRSKGIVPRWPMLLMAFVIALCSVAVASLKDSAGDGGALGRVRVVLFDGDNYVGELLATLVKLNSTFESVLKNTGFVLNYIGLVTKGEISLRVTSLLATACSYGTLWCKWPNPNYLQIGMQSPLLVRAVKITWRVLLKSLEKFSFSQRELDLYHAHFEVHGLSKREFHALLKSGAQWHSAKGGEVIQAEGAPVQSFVLLYTGRCAVVAGGIRVSELGPGSLVGESSFALRHTKGEGSKPPAGELAPAVEKSSRSRLLSAPRSPGGPPPTTTY